VIGKLPHFSAFEILTGKSHVPMCVLCCESPNFVVLCLLLSCRPGQKGNMFLSFALLFGCALFFLPSALLRLRCLFRHLFEVYGETLVRCAHLTSNVSHTHAFSMK